VIKACVLQEDTGPLIAFHNGSSLLDVYSFIDGHTQADLEYLLKLPRCEDELAQSTINIYNSMPSIQYPVLLCHHDKVLFAR